MPETLTQQVETRVVRVERALSDALNDLNGRFWKSAQVEASLSAMKTLKPLIKRWSQEGRDAAYYKTKLKRPGGWSGWIRAGEVYLSGIDEVHDIGDSTLDDIDETIAKAPDVTVDVIKKAGRKAKKVAAKAAASLGRSAWEQISAALPVIAMGVAVAVAVNMITKRMNA